jgi:hypothetical protein
MDRNNVITERLQSALRSFMDESALIERIASVLARASETGSINYISIEAESRDSAEDVVLICWRWRLLIPVKTARSGEWDDKLLVAEPGEVYGMPNVVQYLVRNALETGMWDSRIAIERLFQAMAEPAWEAIPELVGRIRTRCADSRINAFGIKDACRDVGLESRVDTLIAILKGAGIISPRLGPMAEVARAGSPVYELNPCVFAEIGES